jgi:hypothetical protein
VRTHAHIEGSTRGGISIVIDEIVLMGAREVKRAEGIIMTLIYNTSFKVKNMVDAFYLDTEP